MEAGGLLQPCPITGLADDAWDAISQVRDAVETFYPHANSCVRAAGIDSPLLWNKRGNNAGFRRVDCLLKEALEARGLPVTCVVSTNSLVGAVIVQGALLVKHLCETWDLAISESHPSALNHLVNRIGPDQTVRMVQNLTWGLVADERDATLSAISAWASIQKPPQWQNLYDHDLGLFNPSQMPAGYWMPIPYEL